MPKRHKALKKQKTTSKVPLIIVLTLFAVIVGIIFLTKGQASNEVITPSGKNEAMVDQLLSEGKPTFVFFHSTDCYTCKVMMATVADVYPEFQDTVALVDVDVYDASNQNLLQKAQIRSIPTQVFFDGSGKSTVIIGVMEPDALRQHLVTLAGGK